MKVLINTTTILSLALYVVPPFAAQAQDMQSVKVGDQEVICLPNKKAACPEGAFCVVARNPANCQANAEKAVSKAAGEPAAGEQAAGEQAGAEQAAPAEDQTLAEQTAAEEKAAADKAAADQAAAEQAAKDQAAAEEKAAARKAAEDQAAAEAEAKAQADAQAQAQAEAQTDAPPPKPATEDATEGAPGAASDGASDPAATAKALKSVTTANGTEVICLPNKAATCPEGALCVVAAKTAKCEALAEKKVAQSDKTKTPAPDAANGDQALLPPVSPKDPAGEVTAEQIPEKTAEELAAQKAAEEKAAAEQAAMDKANIAAAKAAEEKAAAQAAADPNLKPVEAPVVDKEATKTLETMLAAASPDVSPEAPSAAPVVAAAEEAKDLTTPPQDQPAPKDAKVTTETVTEADTRSSAEDFKAAPVQVAPGKKSGLSDLEKVGLLALGALAIGTMINNNKQQVVSNTGDRVVVRQDDGSYQVYKDDNSLLREPGAKVTTQTFKDGSTRSVVTRPDGSQISTVRDATGRVLQRVAYDRNGRATVLIDDLQPERQVDLSTLPRPRPGANVISVENNDAEMRAALAAANAEEVGQKFSLRQIRTIPQVRYLAPTIDVNNITFETGSAAIQPSEARKLNRLGAFITQMIDDNPGEVFLIEGHTDAVGSAASNLSLSDRRAESVAKALTEYFDVPPENMVVQGYGETELVVDSAGDERANRRVAVRIITPLLKQTAN